MAGRNAAARVLGSRCACRRGRPRSARWRTTSRTPTRGTISRPTSRSGSWRRSTIAHMPRMRAADGRKMSRKEARKLALSERALADLERWMDVERATDFDRRASSRRAGRPMASQATAMKDALVEFLDHLRLNENASLHTVRAYESDLSQFLDVPCRTRATGARADLTPCRLRSPADPRVSRRPAPPRQHAIVGGAEARRDPHVRPLPAARGRHRGRSRPRSSARRSASSACPRIWAKRRCRRCSRCRTPRSRSAAATARSSSCSTPRGFG